MKGIIKKIVSLKLINSVVEILTHVSLIKFKILNPQVMIRVGSSDRAVYSSIFLLDEFKLPFKIDAKLIIDGGAYTGLSSLYFHKSYPNAKIIAIEPENSNFEILMNNTKNIKNIEQLNCGLWYKECFLKIKNSLEEKWGFQLEEVSENGENTMKAMTIDGLLQQSGYSYIDLIKLDIEGAEKEIFGLGSKHWINLTNIIIIELHDRFNPGCSDALFGAIEKNDWNVSYKGEKVVLVRKKMLV